MRKAGGSALPDAPGSVHDWEAGRRWRDPSPPRRVRHPMHRLAMIDIRSAADDAASLDAARSLVRDHILAHSEAHGVGEAEAVAAALPAPYTGPEGGLWVAWDGDAAVGCVALQAIAPGVAELKRMYVRPEARGRGVARRLTEHAIAVATARGFARLRLGTLTTMHAAQRLYASVGFERIEPYRPVEFGDTLFYERALGAAGER